MNRMNRMIAEVIFEYRNAQEVDPKVGELIYPLQRVDLMKFIQNEPIPIRNMKKYMKIVTRKPVGFMQSCCFVFVGILSRYK